jgi:hypothetical protein
MRAKVLRAIDEVKEVVTVGKAVLDEWRLERKRVRDLVRSGSPLLALQPPPTVPPVAQTAADVPDRIVLLRARLACASSPEQRRKILDAEYEYYRAREALRTGT